MGPARGLQFLHDAESQVICRDFPCVVTPMCRGKTQGKTNNYHVFFWKHLGREVLSQLISS
jgi:hypothetical protein